MSMEQRGNQPSFEERLRAAREKQGLEAKPPPPGRSPEDRTPSPLGIGVRIAVDLVSALLVAIAIGWGIDRLAGTKPWFMIGFVPLGMAAGVLNVWRMFAPRDPPRNGKGTG
jgi:ATP synthase protein I